MKQKVNNQYIKKLDNNSIEINPTGLKNFNLITRAGGIMIGFGIIIMGLEWIAQGNSQSFGLTFMALFFIFVGFLIAIIGSLNN